MRMVLLSIVTEHFRATLVKATSPARLGLPASLALDAAAATATLGLQAQGLVRVNCSVGFGQRFVLPLLPEFLFSTLTCSWI
jgi:hypothetical protein